MSPAILVRAALVLLIAGAAVVTPADADLWGHLTFGRDILTTGNPVQSDPYSFTTDRAWVNHEWLSEAVFAALYRHGGSVALIGFKLLVIAALLFAMWTHVRRFARVDVAVVLMFLAFAGSYWRTHNIRPQLFSVLLFVLLLRCIVSADAGHLRRLICVPPLMAIWANLHGGWIVGVAVFGLWAGARMFDRGVSQLQRALPIAIAAMAFAATLINPWGADLWRFLAETVRLGRADIEEWSSVTLYPLVFGVPWALTILSVGVALWRGGLPRRLDYVAVLALLALLSFVVSRLDAFFVVAVVILLAPQFGRIGAPALHAPTGPLPKGALVVATVGIVAIATPVARFAAPFATCLPITGAWAPDAEGARFIAENRLRGRMVTWFDWGEYVIWHFGPALQVSIDGRRETVYSDAVLQAHRSFYGGATAALGYPLQLTADYIWLPAHLPVVQQLESAGWIAVFAGRASGIWARTSAFMSAATPQPVTSARCFPGP